MRASFAVVAVAAILALRATPGSCQAPATPASPAPAAKPTSTDVPDRFRIDLGAFRIGTSTALTLNSPTKGAQVDFESDLTLPDSGTSAWGDVSWRLGRRHQLNLNFTRLNRSGPETTLKRDIPWGEYVYKTSASVQGHVESDYAAGQYRFAIVRNDRFELGPALGFGYFRLKTGVVGPATKDGKGAGSIDVESATSKTAFDLGAYFAAWPARRVELRGDVGYMRLSPQNSSVAVTDGRAALTWFPWPSIGFGAAYKYNKFRYDRDALVLKLGGSYSYQGAVGQISFAFGGAGGSSQ